MRNLRNKLHDRIDMREGLQDEARDLVQRTVTEQLPVVLEKFDKMGDIFNALAEAVAAELDDLTTEAANKGARLFLDE